MAIPSKRCEDEMSLIVGGNPDQDGNMKPIFVGVFIYTLKGFSIKGWGPKTLIGWMVQMNLPVQV